MFTWGVYGCFLATKENRETLPYRFKRKVLLLLFYILLRSLLVFPIVASRPLLPAPARIPDLIHRSQSARPYLRTAIHYYKSAPLKPPQLQAIPCQCETESWLLASTLTEFVSFAVSPAEHHGLLCASLYSCCPSVNALQP